MEYDRPAREDEIAGVSRLFGGDAASQASTRWARGSECPGRSAGSAWHPDDLRPMAEAVGCIKRLIDTPRPLDVEALEAILTAAWHGEPARLAPSARRRVSQPVVVNACSAAMREVADRALEVLRHAGLGGVHVAGLEDGEHLVVLLADLRR